MNKIYSDMLSKAKMLSEGISKNAGELEKKNIRIDCNRLNQLADELSSAAKKQEEAEKALFEARNKAHELWNELKTFCADSKAPIKSSFMPESWSRFGLTDKR